jgi:hypothetical protein
VTHREDPTLTPYEEQWQRYRRNSRAVWFFWLGWLPFGALVVFPAMRFTGSEKLGFGLGFAWMLAFGVFGIRAGNFRCPRCGNKFFSTRWYQNSWSFKCVHCGLPKWSGSQRKPLAGRTISGHRRHRDR